MSGKYENFEQEFNDASFNCEDWEGLYYWTLETVQEADAESAKKDEQLRVLAQQIRSVPLRRNPCTDELECVHQGCKFGVYKGGDPMHGHSPDCPVAIAQQILKEQSDG